MAGVRLGVEIMVLAGETAVGEKVIGAVPVVGL